MGAPEDRGVSVLHVDDEQHFLEMAAAFLERADERITVETAASASDGVDRLAENDIDCVVSDYDMPGQSGIEFLETVRGSHPDMPFILFTGKGSEEVASEAISAGVSDYLQKVSGTDQYDVLANRITNLVGRYRAEARVDRHARQQEESERYRQELVRITSAPDSSDEEKIDELLELGCERLGTENAHLVKIDRETNRHTVVGVHGSDIVRKGITDLSETYCRKTIESDELFEVHDAVEQGWDDDPAYVEFELGCYIGGKILVEDRLFGTLCFASRAPRSEPFTHNEKTFVNLLVQWFSRLLERNRRFNQSETIFQQAQDAIVLVDVLSDQEFRLRRANQAAEDLMGFETDDLRGKTPRAVVGDEIGADIEARYRECVDRVEPLEYDAVFSAGEESVHWRTKLAPVVEDDEVIQLVGVTRDITERKARERTLETLHDATRELMRADSNREIAEIASETAVEVLDLPVNGVHLFDETEDGLVPVATSPANREILGESPTFHRGDGLAWEVYATGEAKIHADVRRASETYNPGTSIRSEMILPLGEHGVFMASSTEVDDFDDGDVALAGVLAANVETALGRARRAAALARRTRELQRQNERLDEFASIVSHDLRNPLNVAEGYLELPRAEYDSDHLDVVANAHDRMRALIDDLLMLARDGKTVEEKEPVDLAALVESCWRNVPTATATLVTDTDRTIRADESRLQQLLENLIRNAVEHGGGDVTVTVGTLVDDTGFYVADDGPGIPANGAGGSTGNDVSGASTNDVSGASGNDVSGAIGNDANETPANDASEGPIERNDTGEPSAGSADGVPDDERARVFEAGFSTAEEGTGFGLSIVERIVEAHDWAVSITDGEAGGARFEVTDVEFAER